MRKVFLSIIFIILSVLCIFAEDIPDGYYDKIDGLQDSVLKSTLHEIIQGGERYAYGTFGYTYQDNIWYPGTWNAFPITDCRADSTIWDMYSNTKRYFPINFGSACGMNIEHCFPKSWWGADSKVLAYKDLYHLNPSDGKANQQKNNYPPGKLISADKFDNGSFRMGRDAAGRIVFEPADIYKGDFARAYFYVATCYEDLQWVEDNAYPLDNQSYLEFDPWLIDVLLSWHRMDPVSEKERNRADIVSSIQHNRNPFIDYPELVEYIWGEKKHQVLNLDSLKIRQMATGEPIEDFTNFVAFPAKNITDKSFFASWKDFQTDYILDVYTKTVTGQNDTLLNFPAISQKIIDNDKSGHISWSGKLNTTGAGNSATVMGASNTDGAISIDMNVPQNARLVFRASIAQTATEAVLQISLDNEEWQIVSLDLDEKWYSLVIPRNVQNITLASIGKSTKKRAALQSLFVVTGNRETIYESIPGFPQTLSDHETIVQVDVPDRDLFYKVKAEGYGLSNEIPLRLDELKSPVDQIFTTKIPRKIMVDGVIYIIHDNQVYNMLGMPVNRERFLQFFE